MSKASQDALENLHGTLVRTLVDAIKADSGNAAILNVARALLKDNGIQADITGNSNLQELADLPVFDSDELPHTKRH